jgi:hypothetical protein
MADFHKIWRKHRIDIEVARTYEHALRAERNAIVPKKFGGMLKGRLSRPRCSVPSMQDP